MLPVLNKALREQCLLPYMSSVFTTRSSVDNTEVSLAAALKEKWPTVGMVNGRIGGTTVSSRRRKSLLRRGCTPTPFSRRCDCAM